MNCYECRQGPLCIVRDGVETALSARKMFDFGRGGLEVYEAMATACARFEGYPEGLELEVDGVVAK